MVRALILVVAVASCGTATASLSPDLPADLQEVVEEAFDEIAAALPAQRRCLATVEIRHSWDLEDRAQYLPAEGAVVLRVPATAADLTFSLAHEVAHHLEVACPSQTGLRPAFVASQGFDPTVPWFDGRSWEETPSEHFATAVAIVVTGRNDPQRPIRIGEEALDLVRAWGAGGLPSG